jgi:predicted RNase H-like HicB family nuclease
MRRSGWSKQTAGGSLRRVAATVSSSTYSSPVALLLQESRLPTYLRACEQHSEAGWPQGEELMRYAVVIEKAGSNYGAYVPDLPGCIATGDSVEEVGENIREAIRFHIDGMKEDCLPIPEPSARAEYVEA